MNEPAEGETAVAASDVAAWAEWRELIDANENACVFHEPVFLRLMADVYNCKAIPQIIEADGGRSGCPLFSVRSILSGRKLTTMPFHAYPKLLGDGDEIAAFLHLTQMAELRGKGTYVEYKTFAGLDIETARGKPIKSTSPSVVSTLPLMQDYDSQVAKYRQSRRTDIRRTRRRAAEAGIEFTTAGEVNMVDQFYDLLCRRYRDKHHMIPQPINLYRRIFYALVPLGMAEFYLALNKGTAVAGLVVLKGKYHWDYSWAASAESHSKLGLNALLVDIAIRDAIVAGAKTFGFGASSPNAAHLIHFKESWGCEQRRIHYYYWNRDPKPIDLQTSFTSIRNVFSYCPIWIIKAMAPVVVPQLV